MFSYLIAVEPLGLLYGSAGRFLSPDNLVGRSGDSFPPRAMAIAGVFAHAWSNDPDKKKELVNLKVAGAFWAKCDDVQNFYVPTPQIYLVDKVTKTVKHRMNWEEVNSKEEKNEESLKGRWKKTDDKDDINKFESGTWQSIEKWDNLEIGSKVKVSSEAWESLPHLHPKLCADERRPYIDETTDKGSLFLENAVQLNPEVCLVYLSNQSLENGWYRFGGEGHMVDIKCHPLNSETIELFDEPVGKSFALISPAVWGSNNFSYRVPGDPNGKKWQDSREVKDIKIEAMLIDRPQPFRYRRGKYLSRGRYAVPAGTVYVLDKAIDSWQNWPESWFPKDRREKEDPNTQEEITKLLTLKSWGCGLALPLRVN